MDTQSLIMLIISAVVTLPVLCPVAAGEVLMTINGWLQIFVFLGQFSQLPSRSACT
jgi:hypothetical protein